MGNFDKDINDRVKFLRKDRGLTQRDFAQSIDIKQSTLSDIERGKIGVSTRLLSKIAEKYNVSPEWLIRGYNGISKANTDKNKVIYAVSPKSVIGDISMREFNYESIECELNSIIRRTNNLMQGYYTDIFMKLGLLAFETKVDSDSMDDDSDPVLDELSELIEPERRFIEQFEPAGRDPNYYKFDLKNKIKIIHDQYYIQAEMLDKIIRIIEILEYQKYCQEDSKS